VDDTDTDVVVRPSLPRLPGQVQRLAASQAWRRLDADGKNCHPKVRSRRRTCGRDR